MWIISNVLVWVEVGVRQPEQKQDGVQEAIATSFFMAQGF